MTKLYIFDVDGTLRWTTVAGARYPLRPDEWRLMPNVVETLRAIPWSADGPWLACASNQCGVGEGRLDRATARALIDAAVVAAVGRLPPRFTVAICTCADGADCPRQKPRSGLLVEIIAGFGVSTVDVLYVGDIAIDEAAARGAGVAFRWAHDFFGWR